MSLPHDVIEEILVRLDAMSLGRSMSVSKQWRSTITSPNFVERHRVRAHHARDTKLLLVHEILNKHSEACMKTISSASPFNVREHAPLTLNPLAQDIRSAVEVTESCDGLLCVYGLITSIFVVNPTTGWHRSLPPATLQQLNMEDFIKFKPCFLGLVPVVGFGRDIVTGTYKIVWMYNFCPPRGRPPNTKCEVFDFSTNTWRFVKAPPYEIYEDQIRPHVNGLLYWLTEELETKLLAFDLHTEEFQVITNIPFVLDVELDDRFEMCNLNDHLCISAENHDENQEIIWGLNPDNTWEKMYSIDLRCTSSWFRPWTLPIPTAVCKDGKILLANRSSDYLAKYDPELGSCGLFYQGHMDHRLFYLGHVGHVISYVETLVSHI